MSYYDRNSTLTRRQFLALAALTSAALAGCGPEAEPQPTPTPTASKTPAPTPSPTPRLLSFFEALAALHKAVRASPDHLMARAEALVAARDAEALARFVRESLTVYPADENGMGSALTGWRWGTRATLRGGAGTPREIAELLAALLRRAGFQAEVVEMPQRGELIVADLLRRAPPLPFVPEIDQTTLTAARRALNLPPPQPPQILDAEGRDSAALATSLLTALGEQVHVPLPFSADERLFYLPTVQLTLNGQPQLVNLWVREGPIFIPPARELKPVAPHRPPLNVVVRLEAARSDAPAERFVLVEKAWSAEDLVGRQIEIAFAPAGARALGDVLANAHDQRTLLVPVLAVRGPDVDAATTQALSAVGSPFTVTGHVLREEAGRVTLDGQPLPPLTATSDGPPIAALELAVNAAGFPLIALALTPRDAQGNMIENLPAARFLVEEDGRPVTALMERWTQPAPRVLLLLDDSDSLPQDFRAQGAQALARALGAQMKATDPRVQFRVAKIYEARADIGSNDWTADPDSLPNQVRDTIGYGSRLWEALADAGRHAPTVIVMITDGQALDADGKLINEPPPAVLAAVQAGPPAVVIGVGEVDAAMLEKLGQAGRLGAFTAQTHEDAIQAVLAALRANPLPPYRLTYFAPERTNQTPRTVRVFERSDYLRGSKRTPLAKASYTPPPPAQRAAGAVISGLFLTVQVDRRSVTRALAGLFTQRSDARPTAAHAADVRRALRGRITLSFEAGSPSLAHLLDDYYTALSSLRPVLEARTRAERLAAVASNALYLPPVDLHVASVPLPGRADEPLTFQTGLRVALHRLLPTQTHDGQPAVVRWLDLLPLAGFRTATTDSAQAFRLTAQRTARLALAEALAFANSTVAAMRDKPLTLARSDLDIQVALRSAGADEAVARRIGDLFAPWIAQRHRIVWTGDMTLAGWAIDEQGSVWGVLGGDGAETAGGGSGLSATTILDGAMLASDLAALMGLGGFSFAGGVWLLLASTLYKKLEAATALLAQLPTSPDDPAPDTRGAERIADPSDIGCSLAQSAAFESISRIGSAFFGEWVSRAVSAISALDGARSMATGSGFFC